MGWSVPLLCAAATTNVLIQSVDGHYCKERNPIDIAFCNQYDDDEKHCKDEQHGGKRCQWVEGVRPELHIDDTMIHMKQNAAANFDMFKSHISNQEFIKSLKSDHLMSLPIDLEMQYTTTITLQLLRALYYQHFQLYGKAEELLLIDWYILAVGSFGRNELLPCSDLDILMLGVGPGLVSKEKYDRMSAAHKGNKEAINNDPALKPYIIADKFAMDMNDAIIKELKHATGATFTSGAFALDKIVPRKFADSMDKILEPFLNVNRKALWMHGGSMDPISFFADVQVIYERIDNQKTPFTKLQHQWIRRVPLDILNDMFKSDIQKNLRDIEIERKGLFAKKGAADKKLAKVTEIKPKYFFIRAYSLLTYWAYLLAYKYPKYPRYSQEPYLMGTVARMNKLAEWGYIQPEVAFWSSYYFHQANIWSLRGNLLIEKGRKPAYTHGKGFVFGKHEKFVKAMLADKSPSIVRLNEFAAAFKAIYDESKLLQKEAKRKSLSSPLDIAASIIEVDEQEIHSELESEGESEEVPAKREYDDNYYENYYYYDLFDGEYNDRMDGYDDDYYDGARLVYHYTPKVHAKQRRNHRNRYGRRGLMDYMNDRERENHYQV